MSERPAFYALRPGAWRDWVTLLHLPYTGLHLAFVVLGAAFAPVLRLERLLATLLAFFLAVGVSAHCFDELRDRPLGTRVAASSLLAGAMVALAFACGIGIIGLYWVSPWLALFIVSGAFVVLAYNLELCGGAFHGGLTFALFWGAFPFLTASFAMDARLGWAAVPGGAACAGLAHLQRCLSTSARTVRRRVDEIQGTLIFSDGSRAPITRETLLSAPEQGLRALCIAVPLLALAALVARLLDQNP